MPFSPSSSIPNNHSTADMLGQLAVALQGLVESGSWSKDNQLEVSIAGTLKNDKFIVIKPVKEKVNSTFNPDLKQKHPFNA